MVKDGDDNILNGRKWFASNALHRNCKVMIVMGKTEPVRIRTEPPSREGDLGLRSGLRRHPGRARDGSRGGTRSHARRRPRRRGGPSHRRHQHGHHPPGRDRRLRICPRHRVFLPETRHQFGRPIGSYQALHNRATQMWIAATQARATSRYAAAILASDGPDAGGLPPRSPSKLPGSASKSPPSSEFVTVCRLIPPPWSPTAAPSSPDTSCRGRSSQSTRYDAPPPAEDPTTAGLVKSWQQSATDICLWPPPDRDAMFVNALRECAQLLPLYPRGHQSSAGAIVTACNCRPSGSVFLQGRR